MVHCPTTRSPSANLANVLADRAAQRGWSDLPAYSIGERTVSHGAIHDGAARTASLLAGLGVGPRDRVLVTAADGFEFVWSFLATVRLGAVAVLANPRASTEDHHRLAQQCGARVAVCEPELADRFAPAATVIDTVTLAAQAAALDPWPPAAVEADSPAYAQCTSGTTGVPKAAVHRHGDPVVYYDAFARAALAMDAGDTVLSVSKMYFAYGLGNSLFFPLFAGAHAVLHAGPPRPPDIAALVERHRATVLFGVPTFYAHLVAHLMGGEAREAGKAGESSGALASLRVAVSAGEPLTVALAERVRAQLGCPILDGLGSTEVGQTFVSNTLSAQRDGTIGRALPPYEVSVRDGGGRELGRGRLGSLWVRGPTVMLGYLGGAGAGAEPGLVGPDGWLGTGDRASIDADGFVTHHGRADDVEMVGGISVAPGEIEVLLGSHPAVTEVAVAGVRDAAGASRLEAFVVAGNGDVALATVGDELMALCRAHLAPFKVPRAVRFVDGLPRTATGKLKRFVLREGGWPPAS